MGAVIAVSNQQKGVGKTTITLNLARQLTDRGFRVLMVDNDPQADLTTSIPAFSPDHQADTLLLYEGHPVEPQEVSGDLFMIGADIGLSVAAEKGYEAVFDFRNELLKFKHDFDFIFIDSLPSLCIMHTAALAASEYLLIVTKPYPLLFKGVRDLIDSSRKVARRLNSGLKMLGIIMNQVDKDDNSTRELIESLFCSYPDLAFRAMLSKYNLLSDNSRSDGMINSLLHDPQCRVINDDLRQLLDEVLMRLDRL